MGWIRFQRVVDEGGFLIRAVDLRYGFTDDPDHSIFSAVARRDPVSGELGRVRVGSSDPGAVNQRLAGLFQETYAPFCSVG